MERNPLVSDHRILTKLPNSSAAMNLLTRVGLQVHCLMHSRGWQVGLLQEMYPTNPGLLGLNINRGAVIRIRLREAHDNTRFIDFEALVCTM